jgi:ABC-type proline/glycine betaine transport system permease subunit
MSKGGNMVIWGLVIGIPLNALVVYLLVFTGDNSQEALDRAWLVFLTVPGFALLGLVLVICGIVSNVRSKEPR